MKKKSTSSSTPSAWSLGVIEPGLGTAIAEGLPGCPVRSDDTVREIVRGCRLHLDKMVAGLGGGVSEKSQLGLGHSYSRCKVKFNPARSDNMIIQSIALLDQMDKDLNTFAMRIREWYSWHFPELKTHVKDNYMFARAAAYVQDRTTLTCEGAEEKVKGLLEIVGDQETSDAVVAAAKTSMGMDCSPIDMVNIVNFTQRMIKLAEYRKELTAYLSDKMDIVAPNLSTLVGDTVAARLISKAGSLTNLAKAPASTVQILGAEKALFRALKTKGNTPKYGLIYHSSFIGRAESKNKGRISRYLANKCSIASRIDSFSDEPTNAYGLKLKEQVEERLKFYETGAAPRKNMDVMKEVAAELKLRNGVPDDDEEMADVSSSKKAKKEKKKKKRKSEAADVVMEDEESTPKKAKVESPEPAAPVSEKKSSKKSKKEKKEVATPEPAAAEEPKSEKKSSKKSKKEKKEVAATPEPAAPEPSKSEKKSSKKSSKKKKKSKD